VKFRQIYRDLPVIAGEVIVNLDRLKNVTSVSGETSPNIDIDVSAAVDLQVAHKKALAEVSKRYPLSKHDLKNRN
jgi:Zn-dependent metalloprotease